MWWVQKYKGGGGELRERNPFRKFIPNKEAKSYDFPSTLQLAFPNSYVVMTLNTGGIDLESIMVKKQLQTKKGKSYIF